MRILGKFLLLPLFLLAFSSSSSMAVDRWVAAGGTDTGDCSNDASPCGSIQYAIGAAVSGADQVLVNDGTYYENIDFSGKAITVQSLNGAALTVIDGGAPAEPDHKIASALAGQCGALH